MKKIYLVMLALMPLVCACSKENVKPVVTHPKTVMDGPDDPTPVDSGGEDKPKPTGQ